MEFNDLFREIMIERNTNIQEISKQTGIDDSVLYDYVKFAVLLANYLNCSINYLMGLDENLNATKFKNTYDVSLFSKRYDELLKQCNTTHYKLSKENGLNYSSHYAWRHGAIPNMHSLITIAKYFDVSIDFLIGREK